MLIAVLRRPEGLFALDARRDEPFAVPAKDAACEAGNYTEAVRRIDPTVPLPYQSVLAHSGLLGVSHPSPQALADTLHVLIGSVPDPGAYSTGLPRPQFDEAEDVPRRTAANPRGFRGTKFKPRKPAAPATRDLLPYLDGGNHEAALLGILSPHLDDALRLCARSATYGSVLEAGAERVLQPYGQAWSRETQAQIPGLPPDFRRYFLWALRAMDWSSVGQLVGAYWSLGLGDDPDLRLIVAQLTARMPGAAGPIDWVSALDAASVPRRACLAELMLETGICGSGYRSPRALVQRLEKLCPADENYRHRAYHLLDRIRQGMPEQYLLDGFALANEYSPGHAFGESGDGNDARSVVEGVMSRLQEHGDEWQRTRFAMQLWERCGKLDQLSETLRDLNWTDLDAESTYWVADFLSGVVDHDAGEQDKEEIWRVVRARATAFVAALQGAPAKHREKLYRTVSQVVWVWDDADRLAEMLDDYFVLVARLCRPPFSVDATSRESLSAFTGLPRSSWHLVRDAPDDSFKAMEKAARRENDARMIAHGIWSLTQCLPEHAARAFLDCPAVLFRCAKTLGFLPGPARERLLATAKKSPAFAADPRGLAAQTLVSLVDQAGDKPSPYVSRRLRDHIRTGAGMTAGQIQRAIDKVILHWSEILFGQLDELAIKSMGKDLHPDMDFDDPKVRHAVMMQSSVAENRRALRKLLKARMAGDAQYLASHPETQNWLRQHPTINMQLWTNGIVHQRSSPSGDVRLSIERDPLEVLRMGTYAGTCLGLGGGQAYSAAAVVLDANKQVVYCRGSQGTVLARQLLALSDKEYLFCFDIYPDAVGESLKKLFWEYDKAFAEALGVPLHDPGDDDEDDDIAFLLAEDWWYDSPVKVE